MSYTSTDDSNHQLDHEGIVGNANYHGTDVNFTIKSPELPVRSLGAAFLIGMTTIAPTLTEDFNVPSMTSLFDPVFSFQEKDTVNNLSGYELINEPKVKNYLSKHPHLYQFLGTSLAQLKTYSETGQVGLEYEGVAEEGWESLFIIIYLGRDDEEFLNTLEDRIVNKWMGQFDSVINDYISITFGWK